MNLLPDAFANVFGSFSYKTALMVAENYDFATATNAKIVGVPIVAYTVHNSEIDASRAGRDFQV